MAFIWSAVRGTQHVGSKGQMQNGKCTCKELMSFIHKHAYTTLHHLPMLIPVYMNAAKCPIN